MQDLQDNRETSTPMTTLKFGDSGIQIPLLSIGEQLPGITPLSEAIALQRSFDHYFVLQEVSTLLSGDASTVESYLLYWQTKATSTLRHHFTLLKNSEQYAYGENSWASKNDSQSSAK